MCAQGEPGADDGAEYGTLGTRPPHVAPMNPEDPVTAYRIWARIEHSGPSEFVAIATAIPENGDPSLVRVLNESCLPAA